MPDASPACNSTSEDAVSHYVEGAVSRLRSMGLRITAPRRALLAALASSRRPVGAYQLRDRVRESGGNIDVVSAYRILAGLVEAGLAHRIVAIDGYVACTAHHQGDHQTEHLVCSKCGCVEELPIPSGASAEIGVSASRQGFQADLTRVEVLGTCEHCR
jgi:Fur family zinc uptake transcriptional regulator